LEALVAGDAQPLIEPGKYDLVLVDYETCLMFGKAQKLKMNFRVVTLGEHNGLVIPRYYNIKRIIGKPAKSGSFQIARGSDFLLEFMTLFEHLGQPKRLDRLPMTNFSKHIIVGKVRTVERNYSQRKLPGSLQYSVVEELLHIKEA
jgi:hypothetical protein